MGTGEGEDWYWCLRHGRVENGAETCPADDRLGPYPSEEAARNWRQRVEERNDKWDADDRAWSGEEPE